MLSSRCVCFLTRLLYPFLLRHRLACLQPQLLSYRALTHALCSPQNGRRRKCDDRDKRKTRQCREEANGEGDSMPCSRARSAGGTPANVDLALAGAQHTSQAEEMTEPRGGARQEADGTPGASSSRSVGGECRRREVAVSAATRQSGAWKSVVMGLNRDHQEGAKSPGTEARRKQLREERFAKTPCAALPAHGVLKGEMGREALKRLNRDERFSKPCPALL